MKKIALTLVFSILMMTGCSTASTVANVTKPLNKDLDRFAQNSISYPEEYPPYEEAVSISEPEGSPKEASQAAKEDMKEAQNNDELKKQQEIQREEELKKQQEIQRQEELKKQQEMQKQEELKKQQEMQKQEELKKQQELQKQEELKKQQELQKQEELKKQQEEEANRVNISTDNTGEMKAVWVSYLEFLTLAQNQTEQGFRNNMDYLLKTSAEFGLNTVFVQVRPFGDALYDSRYFPYSYCLTGTEGIDPGYDPLQIIIDTSKKYGLSIHAWINPYRVRVPGSKKEICADNIVNTYISSGSDAVIRYNGGTYYNPASQKARDLIVAGALEIIENYDVDGIHMDDYFYPTTDKAFDIDYYNSYLNKGGKLSHDDWRRQNVDTLLHQMYSSIKNKDSSIIFGVSPQARMDINYNAQYADVGKWLASSGYVDYVCPQIYFGFEHEKVPYEQTMKMWNDMAKKGNKKLYVGLAAYKCGVLDNGAKSGKNEWVENADMLARQVLSAREFSQYNGFAIYRFDSLFRPEAALKNHMAYERQALKSVM